MADSSFLNQAARFHGHLGPWLALGVRAGRYARRVLRATGMQLQATVYCRGRTPYSCFIDGVQFASGCTLGKGTINHVCTSGCRVVFRHRRPRSGRMLVLELRPEVIAAIARPPAGIGMPALARRLYARRIDSLFRVA
jgi:formylmethanofuran dehydrogenase subunit E